MNMSIDIHISCIFIDVKLEHLNQLLHPQPPNIFTLPLNPVPHSPLPYPINPLPNILILNPIPSDPFA